MRKIIVEISTLTIIFTLLSGCSSVNSPAGKSEDSAVKTEVKEASEVSISLYPGYMEIAKGSKVRLAPKLTPVSTNVNELQWASGNSEIASVSTDGTVTAIKEGDTVIDVVLKGNSTKKASCTVYVKADGSTLVYTGIPQKPLETAKPSVDKNDGGIDEVSDGEVPIEYEKSPDIPVEVIPTLDEFVWSIRIDDICRKSLNTELGDIKAAYHLKLSAVKSGGKTADGQYKCTAIQEVKIDSSDMDQKIESEIGGAVKSDNSVKTELKDCTFDLVRYNSSDYSSYGIKKGELPTLLPLIPFAGMALGNMNFSNNATFGRSVTTGEGSGTGKGSVSKQNQAVPFKIGVGKDGSVELYVMGSGSMGPLQFKGCISKKPIQP